jgi:hypothetical protein
MVVTPKDLISQIFYMKKESLIRAFCFLTFYLSSKIIAAQAPVSEDPNHKVIFENGYIRLLEGRIPAHDTTKVHKHSANSVIVFLSKSTFGIDIPGQPATVTFINAGDTRYAAYGDQPVIHRVWNLGDSMFHFMVVEILRQNPVHDSCSIPFQPGLSLKSRQKSVGIYSMDVISGKQVRLPKSTCAYLLIGVSGAMTAVSSNKKTQLQSGEFVFFPPQSKIAINGGEEGNANCVLLQL